MAGRLFKELEIVVVGETYDRQRRGLAARERLRARLSLLTNDSVEIADASHIGTAFIGLEHLSPSELLNVSRRRFRAAKGQGDTTDVFV